MGVQQVLDEVHDHVVQHQGVHHLADAQLRLQHGGDQHHHGHGRRGGQHRHHRQHAGRQGNIDREEGGNERAQHDAALRAQVELVGGEHDAGGKAGENGGDHGGQHVADVLDVDAAVGPEQGADQQLAQGLAGVGQAVAVRGDED